MVNKNVLFHLCVNIVYWSLWLKEGSFLFTCEQDDVVWRGPRVKMLHDIMCAMIPVLIFSYKHILGKNDPLFWPIFIPWRRAILSLAELNLNGRCLHECSADCGLVNSLLCFSHSLYDLWSRFIQSFLSVSACLSLTDWDRSSASLESYIRSEKMTLAGKCNCSRKVVHLTAPLSCTVYTANDSTVGESNFII